MFKRLKEAVEANGEVMILTDSGEEHELHKHNTDFHDEDGIIEIDASETTQWIDGEKVERYWIHRDF